jgi:hypothetical protein
MPERFMSENTFFEHLGLAGGVLLVAGHDLVRSPASPELKSTIRNSVLVRSTSCALHS